MTKNIIPTVIAAGAALALTACNPYPPVDHVDITEFEAGSVIALPGVELHVRMVLEGDWENRCAANLGGTYRYDGTRVCVVPAP